MGASSLAMVMTSAHVSSARLQVAVEVVGTSAGQLVACDLDRAGARPDAAPRPPSRGCCCASLTSGGSSWSCIVPSCGAQPREVAGVLALGEQSERALGQRDGVGHRALLRLEEAGVPVRRRASRRRLQRLGLGDGLAAQPDGMTRVTAEEVRRRQGHRQLDGLVGAVQVRALELLAHALADLDRGAEITGLTQAAAQRDRALDAEQPTALSRRPAARARGWRRPWSPGSPGRARSDSAPGRQGPPGNRRGRGPVPDAPGTRPRGAGRTRGRARRSRASA